MRHLQNVECRWEIWMDLQIEFGLWDGNPCEAVLAGWKGGEKAKFVTGILIWNPASIQCWNIFQWKFFLRRTYKQLTEIFITI